MAGPKWDGHVPIEGDRICFYRQMGEVGCDANKYGGDVTDVSRQHGAVSGLRFARSVFLPLSNRHRHQATNTGLSTGDMEEALRTVYQCSWVFQLVWARKNEQLGCFVEKAAVKGKGENEWA